MSDENAAPETPEAEIEADVELLSELLLHEFAAIERAADKLHTASAIAPKLDDGVLLGILSRLRVARAMDDFTSIYLDLKDEEAEAARELLEELGDDDEDDDFDFDEEYEDDDEFDDLDDDELEEDEDEDDDFGDLDDDDA